MTDASMQYSTKDWSADCRHHVSIFICTTKLHAKAKRNCRVRCPTECLKRESLFKTYFWRKFTRAGKICFEICPFSVVLPIVNENVRTGSFYCGHKDNTKYLVFCRKLQSYCILNPLHFNDRLSYQNRSKA